MRLNDFIPFLPISQFVLRRAANALASCGHNACRCHAWQLALSSIAALGAPTSRAYKSIMARRESRQARATRTEAIFDRLAAANPTPKGELQYINPFTLLVAVVLSAQATDAGVNKATPALFAIADTPEKMAALGVERVEERIKTIGLYRTKAKNVIALSRAIVEQHGGETPRNREALEALPGVGRKTANVVLNTVFGEPTLAVDTHVFRIANRLNIAPGKTPREVEDGLMRVVPDRFLLHAHHWLILHGRYVCIARKPLCGTCVLVDLCPYEPKNLPSGG
jgi:endonuclease III